jgi:hypothetical protein
MKYYFKRGNDLNLFKPSTTHVGRNLIHRASYVFNVDDNWNIECIKDRDNKYKNGYFTLQVHYNVLSEDQRRFICLVLLERTNNRRVLDFVNDITTGFLIEYLLSDCYSDEGKTRLNLIRQMVIRLKNKDFILHAYNGIH